MLRGLAATVAAALVLSSPVFGAGGGLSNTVGYNVGTTTPSGQIPLTTIPYTVGITSPANLPGPANVTIVVTPLTLTLPTGLTTAQFLSCLKVTPTTLAFTGPDTQKNISVQLVVPTGFPAGVYGYLIATSGWGEAVVDGGTQLNATVGLTTPVTQNPPQVTISSPTNNQVFTYNALTATSVTVPIVIQGSVPSSDQDLITALSGSITGPGLATGGLQLGSGLLSLLGLDSAAAMGKYSFAASAPGMYTVNATATNLINSVTTSVTFTVTQTAPPPTIAASNPAPNATFSYTIGSSAGATVPVSVTGTSQFGDIATLTGSLDGKAITLTTTGVGTALVAMGTTSLTVAAGTHSLVFVTTSAFGSATTTVPFSVTANQPLPPPTIKITAPATGSAYSFAAGGSVSVPYAFTGGTTSGTITSVTASLTGPSTTISPTIAGLNTASISGSGTLTLSAAGTYILSATDKSAGGSASASTTFTVTQTPPPVSGNLYWLPPLSCNNNFCGGAIVPVAFTILTQGSNGCWGGTFVKDVTLVVATWEIYSNGTSSTPVLSTYSASNDNQPNFTIKGSGNSAYYIMNFQAAAGTHHYHAEVYQPVGSSVQDLSDIDFYTSGNSGNSWSCQMNSWNGFGKYSGDDGCGSGNWGCDNSGDYCYYGNDQGDSSYGGSTGDVSGWGCNGNGGWGW